MKRLLIISLVLLITNLASYAEDSFEVEYIFERQELPKGLSGRNCLKVASASTVMKT